MGVVKNFLIILEIGRVQFKKVTQEAPELSPPRDTLNLQQHME